MKKMMTIIMLAGIAMLSGACSARTIDNTGPATLVGSSNRYENNETGYVTDSETEYVTDSETEYGSDSETEYGSDSDAEYGSDSETESYETSPECEEALRAEDYATENWFDAPEGNDDAAWTIMKVIGDRVNDLGCSRYMWEISY